MDERTCKHPECDKATLARGLCSQHYARERRQGLHGPGVCRWEKCSRAVMSRGYCDTHGWRARQLGNYTDPWRYWQDGRKSAATPCRWPECDRTSTGRGFCPTHYQRARNLDDFETPWMHWTRKCETCGEAIEGRNRAQRYCSSTCNLAAWKIVNPDRIRELGRAHAARRRARIRGTTVEDFTEQQVRDRTGDTCYLCGDLIDFQLKWPDQMSPSLDHIVPLSKGGTHTLDNAAMTHFACNNAKNARVLDDAPQFAPPCK